MGLPGVSIIIVAVAAVVGFTAGAEGGYTDMKIWGAVALILSVMSYFDVRELRKKKAVVPQP